MRLCLAPNLGNFITIPSLKLPNIHTLFELDYIPREERNPIVKERESLSQELPDIMAKKVGRLEDDGLHFEIEEREPASQMDTHAAGVALGLLTRWALRRTRRLANPECALSDEVVTGDFSKGCVGEEGDK